MAAVVGIPPNPPLGNESLYVGDLDPLVSEMDLLEIFSDVSGPIASVRLCRDSASGKSLGYGYINYFSRSDASKALHSLNHTKLNDKPMRIMWSQRDPLRRKTGVANLFVKNLDLSVDSACLQDTFCKFGTVLSCKVAEENGRSQGFGFVQFDSEESAMAALNALNDTMLQGKKLYVSKFVKKSDRKACKEPKFTNLYVKNLDQDLTVDILQDKFSEFGKVCNVVIMKDGEGKSRGFGFISFELPEDAKKAVEAMNGAQLGSKNVFVGRAQKKAEREQLLRRQYKEMHDREIEKLKDTNVYVKNLDLSIDDDKLREYFSTCGLPTSVKVMHHENGKSKGFGFVSFSTPNEAKKAVATLNGTMLQGRSLYVAIAQRKEDRRTALQIHYAQYPLGSRCPIREFVSPEHQPPYYYYLPPPNDVSHINPLQPLMYQHFGPDMGALQPPKTQDYRTNHSTYIPMNQAQQGQMRDCVNELSFLHAPVNPYLHHSVHPIDALQGIEQPHFMKYSSSNYPFQELNNGTFADQKPHFKKMGNKSSGPIETSYKGFGAMRSPITATDPLKHKQIIRKLLYPLVEKLQSKLAGKITRMLLEMNNSELVKLLESPDTLAAEVEKAAQELKKENARTGVDGSGGTLPVGTTIYMSY